MVDIFTGLQSVSALVDGIGSFTQKRQFETVVLEAVSDFVLRSSLPSGEKVAILTRLDQRPQVVMDLLSSSTEAEFAEALRRMGISPETVDPRDLATHVQTLVLTRFSFGARPQDLILRDEQNANWQEQHSKTELMFGMLQQIIDQIPVGSGNHLVGSVRDDVVGEVDSGAGSNAILSSTVSFPLLTPWSARLEQALDPTRDLLVNQELLTSYGLLVDQASAERERESLEEELEDIIVLCIEANFEDARSRLESISDRVSSVTLDCQALYHRLQGALSLTLGLLDEAKGSYELALAAIDNPFSESPTLQLRAQWLRRQILSDLVTVEGRLGKPLQALVENQQEMAKIASWHGHPALDAAVRKFLGLIAKEWASESLASESTWRMSSLVAEAIGYYNQALALCYLTGGIWEATEVRLHFVQGLLTLSYANQQEKVALASKELVAAGKPDVLRSFLTKYGHIAAGALDWNVIALRRSGDAGSDVHGNPYDLTTLVAIEMMAPYLDDDVRNQLSNEFQERAVKYLRGLGDPLVSGAFRFGGSFVEAFASIYKPTGHQLQELIDELKGDDPYHPLTMWRVLEEYEWAPEDGAQAESIVDFIENGPQFSVGAPRGLIVILIRISHKVGGFEERVTKLLTDFANANPPAYAPFIWAEYNPVVEPYVLRWLNAVVDGITEKLRQASADGPLMIGMPLWSLGEVTHAVDAYSCCIPSGAIDQITIGILDAVSSNPYILASDKADAYRAVRGLAAHLSDDGRQRLKAKLEALNPLMEEARTIPVGLLANRRDEAILSVLSLRLSLGLRAENEEVGAVLRALHQPGPAGVYRAAVEAAELLIDSNHEGQALLVATSTSLLEAEKRPQVSRVALALRVLVRRLGRSQSPVETRIVEKLEGVMQDGRPYYKQVVLHEATSSWERIEPVVRGHIRAWAESLLGDGHRQVRYWANRLIERSEAR